MLDFSLSSSAIGIGPLIIYLYKLRNNIVAGFFRRAEAGL
jgi:hypothetical protein